MKDGAPFSEKQSLALNSAAMTGDVEAGKAALEAGADVHYKCDLALRSAAKGGHLPMLLYLVRHAGADIHALKDEALRFAVKTGNDNTVETLLKLGADPNAMDGEPLVQAATKGRAGIVKALLAHKANPHFSSDHALRQAAYNGHFDIVRDLVRNKADVFSMRGAAAELAASEKHAGIVEFLSLQMAEERNTFLFELSLPVDTREFLRAPYRDTGEPGIIRAVRMNCLAEATKRMKETGACFTGADLDGLRDRERRPLGFVAADYGGLGKLFDLDLWRGPLDDMTGAWNKIPEALRRSGGLGESDFAGVVAGFRQRALKEKTLKAPRLTGSSGPR